MTRIQPLSCRNRTVTTVDSATPLGGEMLETNSLIYVVVGYTVAHYIFNLPYH